MNRKKSQIVHDLLSRFLPILEHSLEDITRQPRILPKASYRISVPIAAKRNIHADVVACCADDIPQLLFDSKKHLKFISRRWQFQFTNDSQSFPNHQLVMRGNADI